jgi:putative ABC transport system permease protein
MTPQPMRWLVWLLRQVSSRDAANAAVGDLLDELADRAENARAPRWPRLWINTRAITVILSFAVSTAPRLWRSAWHMLRDAARSLRRSPAYSLLVIILLAVGIAAGTITYSVVDAVVLRPLALAQGDRLVSVATRDDQFKTRISPEAFREVRDRVTGLESVAKAMHLSGESATIGGIAHEVDVLHATSDLFRVLRFVPRIGRLWTGDEEARAEDVAVLGYRFWIDRLRGDPDVLGQTIVRGKATYRVIGVLAADTDAPGLTAALWIPAGARLNPFNIVGRTRPGVSPGQAAAEIQSVIGTPDWRPAVVPLIDLYVGPVRGWMLLALGAAGLVVLIACVNAANIMLTRTFRRAHELAIRSSLGASRRQIAWSVMTEGMVLSLAGSVCALACAMWGIEAARAAVTTHLVGTFRASTIALNERVFAASIVAAIATGVFSSLVPAWHASRASVVGVLKDAAPTITGGGRRWRSGLLIGEIACMTVLLVVSWLFVTSLIRVVNIDLGVDRSHLLAVSPRLPFKGTVDDVRRRLEAVPGVTGVAEAGAGGASLPLVGHAFGGAWVTTSIQRTDASGDVAALKVLQYRVTANYFDVAGIRFRRGGGWSDETARESPPVVLDERAAAQLYGPDDPLGRQIRTSHPPGVFTVVGIVPHVYSRGAEVADEPAVYFTLRQSAGRAWSRLFVRTAPPPETMLARVTDALAPVAPPPENGPYIHLADEAVRRLTATRRFNAGLMSVFGCLAMLIGSAGIYGVTAAVVAQQRREIGVRVALGATPHLIHRSVLVLAGVHVLGGLAVGLPLAWWISRGFTAYLFQVTPAEPAVYAGVVALVGLVGLAGAFLPAQRAARTDPMITLRA